MKERIDSVKLGYRVRNCLHDDATNYTHLEILLDRPVRDCSRLGNSINIIYFV